MNTVGHFLIFQLDGEQYGLPLSIIERVIPVVEITRVAEAPSAILGVINVEGQYRNLRGWLLRVIG